MNASMRLTAEDHVQENKSPSKGLVGVVLAGIGALAIAIGHGAPDLFSEVFGHVVGEFLGIDLIIPVIFIAGSWWAASHLLHPRLTWLVPVVGVTGGQLAFFVVVALFLRAEAIFLLSPDIVALAIGLVWLLKAAKRGPIIFLFAYEIIGIAGNILTLTTVELNPGVFSSIIIRIFSLALLWNALSVVKSHRPELLSPSEKHA